MGKIGDIDWPALYKGEELFFYWKVQAYIPDGRCGAAGYSYLRLTWSEDAAAAPAHTTLQ